MPPYILPSSAQPIPIVKPKPIANATVIARLKYAPIKAPNSLISSVAPPFCYKTHTDRYGRYELRVKYPGYYIVEVTKKGYQKATKGVFVQREEEKRLDFQLHRLYSLPIISVYTYVSDPPVIPMPLAGVEITSVSTSSNLSYKGVTDESGRCRLIVKPGRYIVEVYKPGYVPCRKTTTVQVMWGEVASVRIGMKPMKPKILHIKESDNGKTLYVDKDWLMNLTLETNPSTGYQWEITKLNHSALQLIDHFCWGYPHRDPPILGAPCNETWILKPISYGETTIELKYWRTWDPEDPFIKTFRVNIIIGENVL
ncbi:MAG TPA: hypothetical protein ENI45_00060 [Thermoplasmatales archaeon]|nr:hypothetical protein [Thermoplasmatales archaeon]